MRDTREVFKLNIDKLNGYGMLYVYCEVVELYCVEYNMCGYACELNIEQQRVIRANEYKYTRLSVKQFYGSLCDEQRVIGWIQIMLMKSITKKFDELVRK